MPTEHYRPNGKLAQGYFCLNCGQPCGLTGHINCTEDDILVKQVMAANPRQGKPRFIYEWDKGSLK